ncbi:PREDICTED: uncharacterized protein LOC109344675 [Lupinus angustifolius]|uniref:uncharacterized protein LOC109344675 n=1 Tax=Lupinus angustifolius TaxID=3871 RepID=UPI00092F96E3|nr:PREDICTED: uncharacterized protein LOC109344675 [Lupinus angustifolius]
MQHDHWKQAIHTELDAWAKNHTWILTNLPPDKKAIRCKWIFKTKHHVDGSVERYKARLVAQGFTQTEGVDYMETFSPVVKMTTIRTPPGLNISDPTLVYKLQKSIYGLKQATILVYVDDLILTGTSIDQIIHTKTVLHNKFSIKDLGELKFFLGMEVARSKQGITIYQRKYTLELLQET